MDNTIINAIADAVADRLAKRPETPEKLYYGTSEVLKMCGISRTTLWRAVKDGDFPPPHMIRETAKWTLDEIKSIGKKEKKARRLPASRILERKNKMNTINRPISQIVDEYAEARKTHIRALDSSTKAYYPFPLAKDDIRKVYIMYVHKYERDYLAYLCASGKIPVYVDREEKKLRHCTFYVPKIGTLQVYTTSDGKQRYKRLATSIIGWCLGRGVGKARQELDGVTAWGAPNTQNHWFCGLSFATALKPDCDTNLVQQTLDRHIQEALTPFTTYPIISAVVDGYEIPPLDW